VGTISVRTPTYTWTKSAGATKYQLEVYQGATKVFSATYSSSVCLGNNCSNTPAKTLAYAAHQWRVRAYKGGAWKAWSAFKTFTVMDVPVIPTPQSPSGTITDSTPTYVWTAVAGATQYHIEVVQGASTVYTPIIGAFICGTSTCSHTSSIVLSNGDYQWRVQAQIDGVWKPYSAYQSFTLIADTQNPMAGFWQSTYDEFYVTPDQAYVDDFATYISVEGCGNYKITHTLPEPIVDNQFSFTGTFYANGTFNTTTTAQGTDGLTNFNIPGCGTVTGGPWPWSATWQDSSQPLVVLESEAASIFKVISQTPYFHIIEEVISP
jgi:hypothetical protein